MQRFNDKMVEDVEGDYVLYDGRKSRAIVQTLEDNGINTKLLQTNERTTGATTMKRYRYNCGTLVENEHGGFVRWLDHASALFKQGQRHVEELTVFHDEIKRLKMVDEIECLKNEYVERYLNVVQHKCEDTVKRDEIIKERDKKIDRRNKIIEERNSRITALELSVEKRDEMLIKYEEIIETQKQDNIRLERIIESYRQDIAILREF